MLKLIESKKSITRWPNGLKSPWHIDTSWLNANVSIFDLLNKKQFVAATSSNDLKYSVETNSSIIDTWGCYGFFNDFNIVQQFENREEKFCDYQFDVMSIGSELFFTMINSKATVVGFYYKQNKQESTYNFKVYIK